MKLPFKDWLNARYEADARARNKELERIAISHLNKYDQLKIVDLGAGTGSNFRYYHELLSANRQYWIMLDLDKNLNLEAQKNIQERYGKDHALRADPLRIKTANRDISIEFRVNDIFKDDLSDILDGTDLIVSNALFDLASADQFESFCKKLPLKKAVLLTTMNYENTILHPVEVADNDIIKMFHDHMSRKQSFGRSMGAKCVAQIAQVLRQHSQSVSMGPSDWKLHKNDTILTQGVLDFIENAAIESKYDSEPFINWMSERIKQLENGDLMIEVKHHDILSLPDR